MGAIRWYKRDPDAALAGTLGLSLEERGALITVLDLIYSRSNNLPDDDRFIAGHLRSDPRIWKRLKKKLIEAGKLYVKDGLVRNRRADEEIEDCLRRLQSASEAGRASARSKASKSHADVNLNNGLDSAAVPTRDQRPIEPSTPTSTPTTTPTTTTTTTKVTKEKEGEGAVINTRRVGSGVGKNGRTTIDDPAERVGRFQAWLARKIGPYGWEAVIAATNPEAPNHAYCLKLCKEAAKSNGKGWPHQWPC